MPAVAQQVVGKGTKSLEFAGMPGQVRLVHLRVQVFRRPVVLGAENVFEFAPALDDGRVIKIDPFRVGRNQQNLLTTP